MERYLFAIFVPECGAAVAVEEVVRSEERTKGTGFRRMPVSKGRWDSTGRK
jgi:hypothetical protein